jgi:hypothetical protein
MPDRHQFRHCSWPIDGYWQFLTKAWNVGRSRGLLHGQTQETLMRLIAITTAAIGLFASVALAQPTPAQPGPQNPAVKSMNQNNSPQPVAGANSFTMGEAKSHIEDKGYTRVRNLKKDGSGVWRGMAMKDGKSTPVSVDYQGNVN